ncbi:MAG TPA: hypothetical protein VFL14_03655 [Xanthomonadales bacterium]|nr:hypothetical protein [Xanthomonadales bacterium]
MNLEVMVKKHSNSRIVGRLLESDEQAAVSGAGGYAQGGNYYQNSGGYTQTGGGEHYQSGGGPYGKAVHEN